MYQRSILSILIFLLALNPVYSQTPSSTDSPEPYADIARAVIDTAMVNGRAYSLLEELCRDIGPRLSGSPQAAAAVEWGRLTMMDYGFQNVRLQPVMVPRWLRGEVEAAYIVNSSIVGTVPMAISALGGSIGTPEPGILAPVIEVAGLKAVQKLGARARGKIIFYNRPMDPTRMRTFAAYGGAVNQRTQGAIEAAKVGAVAVLVRSVTTRMDKVPHTGVMHYQPDVPKIPAAAISTVDAELLSRLIKHENKVLVRLQLSCRQKPDVQSYNVIGEIPGTEKPNEVILLGAHLDSWDVAACAHDDGAGCVHIIEALRLIKALGLKPKRTIRAVLFMCEEFGTRGGPAYADSVKNSSIRHLVAIESDRGGFAPRGFSVSADSATMQKIKRWEYLLEPMGAGHIFKGGGGADISPLAKLGAVTMGLVVDDFRYFDYHHSANDTFDKVNKRELELGAAALAILSYVLAMEGI